MDKRKDWEKSTLKERIDFLRESRGGVSQTALGKKAGIKGGPMSKLASRPNPSAEKLSVLAAAWKVSLLWLAKGQGPMDLPAPMSDDRYPNRAIAAQQAREMGDISEEAIVSVLGDVLQSETDHPVQWWVRRMEHRVIVLQRGADELGPLLELQPPPPRGRKK